MTDWIPLLQALVWPTFIAAFVIGFRDSIVSVR